MRLLDGVPADALERVWAKVSAAKIERDPADTWTAETDVDPIKTAAWKDLKFGAGWNKPSDDWTLEDKGAEGGTVASKGTTSLRIDTRAGGLQENLLKLVVEFKKRHPTAALDMRTIQESAIGTKEAAKFVMPDGATTRHIYVAPIGDALLIADFAFPTADTCEAARRPWPRRWRAFSFDNFAPGEGRRSRAPPRAKFSYSDRTHHASNRVAARTGTRRSGNRLW